MIDDEPGSPGLRIAPYVLPPNGRDEPVTHQTPVGGGLPGEGPILFEADSWDHPPSNDSANEAYRGVRRANGSKSRLRVGVVAALVVLVAAVAIPLIFLTGASDDPGDNHGQFLPPAGTDNASGPPAGAAASAPAASEAVHTAASAAAGPGFADVSYEAEAGPPETKLRGSAQVVAVAGASGGQVVRGIGNWGQSGTGSIQFRSVTVPTDGTYRIALVYVPDDGSAGLSAVVEVGTVTVTAAFAGGSGCCAVTTVDVVLTAGTHAVSIANPAGGVPPLDKIVVSRV